MSTPGGGADRADAGRAAQERLTEEARATASALIDWLGTRVDAPSGNAAAGSRRTTAGHSRLGMRPPQSPGPCAWCPICALVAALRGEQPELTARLAEQASGLMTLLRLMVQSHQDPAHAHHHTPPGAAAPAGWPAEWGAWDAWGAGGSAAASTTATPAPGAAPGHAPADRPDAGEDATATAAAPAAGKGDAPAAGDGDGTAAGTTAGNGDGTGDGPESPAPRPRRPAASGPAGPRRVPIRRASPRSAAFRDVPTTTGPAPHRAATGDPQPDPAPTPDAPTPQTPQTPQPPQHHQTPPAPSRPAVQRIAIRRPERPARPSGKPRPDGTGGAGGPAG